MSAYDRNNVFARILRGELPCKRVYEDEFALAFHGVECGPFVGLAAADQVAVGARAGHDAAVVGGDADQPWRQPQRAGRCQVVAGMAAAFGVDPTDLGIGWLVRHHRPQPLCAGGQARHDAGHRWQRARMRQHRVDIAQALQQLQDLVGGRRQLQLLAPLQTFGRGQP